jgi:hypothetical protein
MKLKNINAAFLILSGLLFSSLAFFAVAQVNSSGTKNVFLDSDQDGLTDEEEKLYGTDMHGRDTDGDGYSDGAEVKSGYDPLRPAPGDKLNLLVQKEKEKQAKTLTSSADDREDNLTKKVAQKISSLTEKASSEGENIDISMIETLVNEALNEENETGEEPLAVSKSELKIKKQNYSGYSEKKANEKRKEDLENYLIAVYYIFSSNSPKPITSATDMSSIIKGLSSTMISAISNRDSSALEEISQSGEKIFSQIKEVEVPEELVDMDIQALTFAKEVIAIKDNLKPSTDDPLGDIAKLSKIQSLMSALVDFYGQLEKKMNEYGIVYDDEMKNKIENYGVFAPNKEDLDKLEEEYNENKNSDEE